MEMEFFNAELRYLWMFTSGMYMYALHFSVHLHASRCYGLRLSVLNKETTYLLTTTL